MTTRSIANTHMPNCPAHEEAGDVKFLVVLVENDMGVRKSFAAYCGIVPSPHPGQWAGWVADRGRKLCWRECVQHFPHIKELEYQH